jgi:hypothetical protein
LGGSLGTQQVQTIIKTVPYCISCVGLLLRGPRNGSIFGQLVLVKQKEIGLLNGSGRIERSRVPFVNGRIMDCGRASGDWYDTDALNRCLFEAQNNQWCHGVVEEARSLFVKWNWRQSVQAPFVITGLVIASWLQSLWTWRPQVFVTGNSNTGKTVLLQDVISEAPRQGDLRR